MGKIGLCCDYIDDRDLFKAVCSAIGQMRVGVMPARANARAARKYGVSLADVSYYTGQHAVRVKENRRGLRRADEDG